MKFFIRTDKKQGSATLYYEAQRRTPKMHVKVATPIAVSISDWNATDWSNTKSVAKFSKTYPSIVDEMQLIEDVVNNAILNGKTTRAELAKAIEDVYYKEIREAEEQRRAEEEAKRIKEQNNILNYTARYIEDMRNGKILTDGRNFSEGAIQSHCAFFIHLKNFYSVHPFDWNDINEDLLSEYTSFLFAQNLMRSSVNRALSSLRTIVGVAYRNNIHNNERALHSFSTISINEDERKAEIYLTNEELQALYEMPLIGKIARYRDMFLVGCYTCQRFSDYSRIDKECFYTTTKGNKVVRLIQEKTGKDVVIPVLNDNLFRIMERNDYAFPKVSKPTIINHIQNLLKQLSKKIPTLATPVATMLTKYSAEAEKKGNATYQRDKHGRVVRPKYELVGTHTARRSGITNLYLTGLYDTRQMMSISGHKSADVFAHYIRLTAEEFADKIAEATIKAESKAVSF